MAPNLEKNIFRLYALGVVKAANKVILGDVVKELDHRKPGFAKHIDKKLKRAFMTQVRLIYPNTQALEIRENKFLRPNGEILNSLRIHDASGKPCTIPAEQIVGRQLINQAVQFNDQFNPFSFLRRKK